MKNERKRVFEVAKELGVSIGDVQHGLQVMNLPKRLQSTGWVSSQHVATLRRGLDQGVWVSGASRRKPAETVYRPPRRRQGRFKCRCCAEMIAVDLAEDDPIPSLCPACHEHAAEVDVDTDAARLRILQAHLDTVQRRNSQLDHTAWSVGLVGLEGRIVEVDADIGAGLPRTGIGGTFGLCSVSGP